MKQIIHTDCEGRPCPTDDDDCMIGNLSSPVIRTGDEPFNSFYAVEYGYYCHSEIDPSRSYVNALLKITDERCSPENNWPASDAIHFLLGDLGFACEHLTKPDLVAFWTMFPKGLSGFLSMPYMKLRSFNHPHGEVTRVLNNPWFYKDANAPEKRLVEIANLDGFRFALDRACYIAPPDVLARELALLNYGCYRPYKVDEISNDLTKHIGEIMDDWGLIPTVM